MWEAWNDQPSMFYTDSCKKKWKKKPPKVTDNRNFQGNTDTRISGVYTQKLNEKHPSHDLHYQNQH